MTEEATLNGLVLSRKGLQWHVVNKRDSHLMAWPIKPLLGYFKLTQYLEL
jgi:hypothetical protein